jgi:hypothetical protein
MHGTLAPAIAVQIFSLAFEQIHDEVGKTPSYSIGGIIIRKKIALPELFLVSLVLPGIHGLYLGKQCLDQHTFLGEFQQSIDPLLHRGFWTKLAKSWSKNGSILAELFQLLRCKGIQDQVTNHCRLNCAGRSDPE